MHLHLLGDIGVLLLIGGGAWLGWHWPTRGTRRQEEGRRMGYIERHPDASQRGHWGVEHPTVREVGRAYRSVRNARGLSGNGWWPRRPRP